MHPCRTFTVNGAAKQSSLDTVGAALDTASLVLHAFGRLGSSPCGMNSVEGIHTATLQCSTMVEGRSGSQLRK